MSRRTPTKIPLWAYVPEPIARIVRVGALITTIVAIVASTWAYRVRAQLTDELLETGSAMLHYDGATRQDSDRTLVLNGQQIHLSSGMSPHGFTEVLDFYEGHCLDHDGGLVEELKAYEASQRAVSLYWDELKPLIRSESPDRGVVACLYMEETDGAAGFMERYHRYTESGDIADVGDMRYIYAEEGEGGTHFVAFWTDGPFVLRDMVPDEGDVPGQDIQNVDRPDGLRRRLSAHEAGTPQAVTIYISEEDGPTEADVELFYRDTLVRNGWQLLEAPAGQTTSPALPLRMVAAERDARMVTMLFSTNDENRAVTTVLESR